MCNGTYLLISWMGMVKGANHAGRRLESSCAELDFGRWSHRSKRGASARAERGRNRSSIELIVHVSREKVLGQIGRAPGINYLA